MALAIYEYGGLSTWDSCFGELQELQTDAGPIAAGEIAVRLLNGPVQIEEGEAFVGAVLTRAPGVRITMDDGETLTLTRQHRVVLDHWWESESDYQMVVKPAVECVPGTRLACGGVVVARDLLPPIDAVRLWTDDPWPVQTPGGALLGTRLHETAHGLALGEWQWNSTAYCPQFHPHTRIGVAQDTIPAERDLARRLARRERAIDSGQYVRPEYMDTWSVTSRLGLLDHLRRSEQGYDRPFHPVYPDHLLSGREVTSSMIGRLPLGNFPSWEALCVEIGGSEWTGSDPVERMEKRRSRPGSARRAEVVT